MFSLQRKGTIVNGHYYCRDCAGRAERLLQEELGDAAWREMAAQRIRILRQIARPAQVCKPTWDRYEHKDGSSSYLPGQVYFVPLKGVWVLKENGDLVLTDSRPNTDPASPYYKFGPYGPGA